MSWRLPAFLLPLLLVASVPLFAHAGFDKTADDDCKPVDTRCGCGEVWDQKLKPPKCRKAGKGEANMYKCECTSKLKPAGGFCRAQFDCKGTWFKDQDGKMQSPKTEEDFKKAVGSLPDSSPDQPIPETPNQQIPSTDALKEDLAQASNDVSKYQDALDTAAFGGDPDAMARMEQSLAEAQAAQADAFQKLNELASGESPQAPSAEEAIRAWEDQNQQAAQELAEKQALYQWEGQNQQAAQEMAEKQALYQWDKDQADTFGKNGGQTAGEGEKPWWEKAWDALQTSGEWLGDKIADAVKDLGDQFAERNDLGGPKAPPTAEELERIGKQAAAENLQGKEITPSKFADIKTPYDDMTPEQLAEEAAAEEAREKAIGKEAAEGKLGAQADPNEPLEEEQPVDTRDDVEKAMDAAKEKIAEGADKINKGLDDINKRLDDLGDRVQQDLDTLQDQNRWLAAMKGGVDKMLDRLGYGAPSPSPEPAVASGPAAFYTGNLALEGKADFTVAGANEGFDYPDMSYVAPQEIDWSRIANSDVLSYGSGVPDSDVLSYGNDWLNPADYPLGPSPSDVQPYLASEDEGKAFVPSEEQVLAEADAERAREAEEIAAKERAFAERPEEPQTPGQIIAKQICEATGFMCSAEARGGHCPNKNCWGIGGAGKYETYPSDEAAAKRYMDLWKKYVNSGANTVDKFLNRWVDPSNGATSAKDYARYVSGVKNALGTNVLDANNADQAITMMKAQAYYEQGVSRLPFSSEAIQSAAQRAFPSYSPSGVASGYGPTGNQVTGSFGNYEGFTGAYVTGPAYNFAPGVEGLQTGSDFVSGASNGGFDYPDMSYSAPLDYPDMSYEAPWMQDVGFSGYSPPWEADVGFTGPSGPQRTDWSRVAFEDFDAGNPQLNRLGTEYDPATSQASPASRSLAGILGPVDQPAISPGDLDAQNPQLNRLGTEYYPDSVGPAVSPGDLDAQNPQLNRLGTEYFPGLTPQPAVSPGDLDSQNPQLNRLGTEYYPDALQLQPAVSPGDLDAQNPQANRLGTEYSPDSRESAGAETSKKISGISGEPPPGDNCQTLYCWYKANGRDLPPVSERGDYGPDARPGTAAGNTQMLRDLQADARRNATLAEGGRPLLDSDFMPKNVTPSPVQYDANDQRLAQQPAPGDKETRQIQGTRTGLENFSTYDSAAEQAALREAIVRNQIDQDSSARELDDRVLADTQRRYEEAKAAINPKETDFERWAEQQERYLKAANDFEMKKDELRAFRGEERDGTSKRLERTMQAAYDRLQEGPGWDDQPRQDQLNREYLAAKAEYDEYTDRQALKSAEEAVVRNQIVQDSIARAVDNIQQIAQEARGEWQKWWDDINEEYFGSQTPQPTPPEPSLGVGDEEYLSTPEEREQTRAEAERQAAQQGTKADEERRADEAAQEAQRAQEAAAKAEADRVTAAEKAAADKATAAQAEAAKAAEAKNEAQRAAAAKHAKELEELKKVSDRSLAWANQRSDERNLEEIRAKQRLLEKALQAVKEDPNLPANVKKLASKEAKNANAALTHAGAVLSAAIKNNDDRVLSLSEISKSEATSLYLSGGRAAVRQRVTQYVNGLIGYASARGVSVANALRRIGR